MDSIIEKIINPVEHNIAETSSSQQTTTPQLKLSKKRWFILFLFSITTMVNATLYNSISAINDTVTMYYGVDSTVIDWIPNSVTLLVIIIAFPTAYFMTSQGLRVCMLGATCFHVICTSLHFAGVGRNGFPFVLVGEIFVALGAGVILQVPPRLSTVWFAAGEHATATSIAFFANIFGAAVGFIQATNMVPGKGDIDVIANDIYYFYLSQLLFCVVNLILVVFYFDEAPPYPPTYAALATSSDGDKKGISLMESLKVMVKDKYVIILSNAYGLYFGMYGCLGICLNELVKSEVSDDNVGWMGFAYNCVGILGIIVTGVIIDKYKCYRLVGSLLVFGALILFVAFAYLLLYVKTELLLFITYSAQGLFGIPYFSVGVEQLAEMTYPVPEGTSAGVLVIISNAYTFVAILVLGTLIDHGNKRIVCYMITGIYLLALLLLCVTKTKLKRQEEEENHEHDDSARIEGQIIN